MIESVEDFTNEKYTYTLSLETDVVSDPFGFKKPRKVTEWIVRRDDLRLGSFKTRKAAMVLVAMLLNHK